MNLNKLLCKYLGRDGRDYVIVGDLILAAAGVTIGLIILAAAIQGGIFVYNAGTLPDAENHASAEFACIFAFVLVGLFMVAAIAATLLTFVICVIEAIWETKIAKCTRKDGDDE